MPRTYDTFDDFMDDLDRSSGLSDDPFGVEVPEGLSDEDLALIGGGKTRTAPVKPKPKARRAPAKKKTAPVIDTNIAFQIVDYLTWVFRHTKTVMAVVFGAGVLSGLFLGHIAI